MYAQSLSVTRTKVNSTGVSFEIANADLLAVILIHSTTHILVHKLAKQVILIAVALVDLLLSKMLLLMYASM